MTPDPPVGLIGLTPVHGEVGKLIQFGQWLNGDEFAQWEHAFISIGHGLIVEAEPGGARVNHAYAYPTVHWCNNLYKLGTPSQLWQTEDIAKCFIGTQYSALDYFALVQHRLHLPGLGLKKFIASQGHMICSQLADACYQKAGIHIFSDNRWPGYVTPADLYARDMELR